MTTCWTAWTSDTPSVEEKNCPTLQLRKGQVSYLQPSILGRYYLRS